MVDGPNVMMWSLLSLPLLIKWQPEPFHWLQYCEHSDK